MLTNESASLAELDQSAPGVGSTGAFNLNPSVWTRLVFVYATTERDFLASRREFHVSELKGALAHTGQLLGSRPNMLAWLLDCFQVQHASLDTTHRPDPRLQDQQAPEEILSKALGSP
ncbi:hypothetical protein Bbelb_120480 [Branchiostoma belcheri]|nr:hypothetical protein Bbelb_120480 [Branchiostoma belcheri]